MQPEPWSQQRSRIASLALVVLLVGSALAAPAAADPQMYFDGADVEHESVLVGENVTVNAYVENIGDSGGGYELNYARNGSRFASEWVTVDAGENRQFNESVAFEEPGTYEITVNGERAGLVEVRQAVATVEETTDDRRTMALRGQSVPTGERHAVALPSSANRSVALDRLSVRTAGSNYEGTLTEYADPAEAGVDLPPENDSTLVGLATVDSNESVEAATVRFAVADARLDDAGLDREAVTVFQRNESRWEPLETDVVAERNGTTVYEASATAGTAYAAGRVDAGVSVVGSSIDTEPVESGQRITFDATLKNAGSVDSEYEGALTVDGEAVNSTTVTVPAASERTVTLSYVVTESGNYELALGDSARSTVIVTEAQASGGTEADEAAQSGPVGENSLLPDPVPAGVLGVNTLFIGVGVALALVVATLLLRRGGDSGGGGFEEL
jgi:hypothetical protein